MQWQAITLFARLTPSKPFTKGDGSDYEKLNWIYNQSKHADPDNLPADVLHAIWISNDGIHIPGMCLTFSEIEGLLVELGGIADHASSVRYSNVSTANSDRPEPNSTAV